MEKYTKRGDGCTMKLPRYKLKKGVNLNNVILFGLIASLPHGVFLDVMEALTPNPLPSWSVIFFSLIYYGVLFYYIFNLAFERRNILKEVAEEL